MQKGPETAHPVLEIQAGVAPDFALAFESGGKDYQAIGVPLIDSIDWNVDDEELQFQQLA